MNKITIGVALYLCTTVVIEAGAQDSAAVCGLIPTEASRNINLTENSSEYLNTVFDKYCEQSGTVRQSGFSMGASFPADAIPIKFSLGATDATRALKNFCHEYASVASSRIQQRSYANIVVEHSLNTFVDCVRIARTGNFLKHDILNNQSANIDITAASGAKLTLKGVKVVPPNNITCSVNTGKNQETVFTQKTRYEMEGSLTLACERTGREHGGTTIFPEATVTVSLNVGGSYAFLWPKSVELPINEASAIQSQISLLKRNLEENGISIGDINNKLDVLKGLRGKFIKTRNNGGVSCDEYCGGLEKEWGGVATNGSCLGARMVAGPTPGRHIGCSIKPNDASGGQRSDTDCTCWKPDS